MENYKEKYEQALERANQAIKECGYNQGRIKMIESIFPELAESEDERVRKSIIDLVEKQMPKSENKKWMIDWLERQKEVVEEYEDKLDRCACESFDKGYKAATEKIDAIENFDTEFEKQVSHLIASIINKEYEYTSDFVKWTANALLNYAKHELEKQVKQKTAWNEEDERNLEEIINEIEANKNNAPDYDLATYDRFLSWLKSLKDRVQPQPKQEWSEEEKARIDNIIDVLDWAEEKGHIHYSDWEDYVCYVKSLKPQNTWKPSDEQMRELAIVATGRGWFNKEVLSELLEQLKKLREIV